MTEPGEDADSGAPGDVLSAATNSSEHSEHQAPPDSGLAEEPPDGHAPAREPAPPAEVTDPAPGSAAASDGQSPDAPPETPQGQTWAAAPPPGGAAADTTTAGTTAAETPRADTADSEIPTDDVPEPLAPAPEPTPPETAADAIPAAELRAALADLGDRVDAVANAAAELSRLRSRDTDLIARLHDDVTTLRSGEIATALNPVVIGMIKLHDQMVSLGALDDPASPVGLLHTQLLQIMELTCAVRPFTPAVGEQFDATRHTGTRRRPTTDAALDGTVAAAIKAGFVRADGSVVRVAEVEVNRLSA